MVKCLKKRLTKWSVFSLPVSWWLLVQLWRTNCVAEENIHSSSSSVQSQLPALPHSLSPPVLILQVRTSSPHSQRRLSGSIRVCAVKALVWVGRCIKTSRLSLAGLQCWSLWNQGQSNYASPWNRSLWSRLRFWLIPRSIIYSLPLLIGCSVLTRTVFFSLSSIVFHTVTTRYRKCLHI